MVWILEEDFRLAKLILDSGWRHTGRCRVEDSDEEEDYVMTDHYERDDGSSAEVFYFDEDMTDIADIRFFMAVDGQERKDFEDACREYEREHGEDPGEFTFMQYLYDKALDMPF